MPNDFNSAFQASGVPITTPSSSLSAAASNVPQSMPLAVTTPHVSETSPATSSPLVTTGIHRRSHDPYGDFNFVVEIDGLSAGAFQKCDGLNFEVDMIEYQHGMDPYPRKRRGVVKWGNIRLTKGYTTNNELWKWCQEIMKGKPGRRTGAIHLLADDNNTSVPVKTFKWINGFPVKWSGFKFDAKSDSPLVEEIEFCVEEVMEG